MIQYVMQLASDCQSCKSKNIRRLSKKYPEHLYRCCECGLVFFRSIPTESELTSHYENYPVKSGLPDVTRKRYHELLDKLEPFRKNNRILDIGCGEGFFLEVALSRGWEVHGTEFSSLYIPLCASKGINMRQGRLHVDNYTEKSFDVITWFEVIEHIDTPNAELEKFKKLLRPGGAIYLTTPNFQSLSRFVLKSKWSAITYPDHLCYYSPNSLRSLFERHGFSASSISTTGISIGRVVDSLKGRTNQSEQEFHEIDREWQERMEKKGIMSMLKAVANRLLDMTGTGDSLKALFTSND